MSHEQARSSIVYDRTRGGVVSPAVFRRKPASGFRGIAAGNQVFPAV
jgi:hypothetical protein